MARKRFSDEDALKILREIDVNFNDGFDVVSSCCKAEFQIRHIIIDVRSCVRRDAHSFLRGVCFKGHIHLKKIISEL